jgi:hypothetical protein
MDLGDVLRMLLAKAGRGSIMDVDMCPARKVSIMKPLSLLSLFLISVFALVGCLPVSPTMQPTLAATVPTIAITVLTPTGTASLPSNTPSPTMTWTPLYTLEPVLVRETLQPLIKEPMNCAVPCFWGIIPGKTSLDEAKTFFSKLGFTPFEGMDRNTPSSGMYFYTISYDSGSGYPSSVTLYASNNLVEDIVVNPRIPKPKEGSPREWIAYSPETLIKRYGEPSRVEFYVRSYGLAGSPPNIAVDMIMYFDTSDLIVHYSGGGMTPHRFCPLTAPFDFVRLWMGQNPPDTPPSFGTVSLEKATSLTMEQFTQLMTGDPKKACFKLKEEMFP